MTKHKRQPGDEESRDPTAHGHHGAHHGHHGAHQQARGGEDDPKPSEAGDGPEAPPVEDTLQAILQELQAIRHDQAEDRGRLAALEFKLGQTAPEPKQSTAAPIGVVAYRGDLPRGARLERYRVELPDSATRIIEVPVYPGLDAMIAREMAVAAFNKEMNITNTTRSHTVSKADSEPVPATSAAVQSPENEFAVRQP